jgi:starch phosphorylase
VLENEVIPCFYSRDEAGLPRDWIGRMRESMARLTTRFSSNRMLREYVEQYYLPLAAARGRRTVEVAAGLQDWEEQLMRHWQRLHFGNVGSTRTQAGHRFEVQVYLDEMPAEAVSVELYADPVGEGGPVRQPLQRGTLLAGAANAYVYHGTVPDTRPATDYTARIIPAHADAIVPHEAGFILWHR